ncbi:hypothetical protein BGZ81_007804 [Podila clonocystis]|nr:hypothetical protein BGZ81_007804 [Podila clonocystis]
MYYSDEEEEDYYNSDDNSDNSLHDSDDGNNSADEERRKLAVAAYETQQQLKQAKDLEQDLDAIKDRDDSQKSAVMWMETLAAEGSFVFFEHGQYYAFSVPWQLEQTLNYGDVVIIDRIPNVFGPYSFLYTLLVMNSGTEKAIPVSYLLTKSGKTNFIGSWMNAFAAHIKDKLDVVYTPKVAFTKRDNFRVSTIQEIFPGSRVLYCDSMEDVTAKISRLVKKPPHEHYFFTPKQKEANRRKAERVVKEFEKLMRERYPATAIDSLSKFRCKYQGEEFLEYLEKHCFAEKESWMCAYRQGVSCATIVNSGHGATWKLSLRGKFAMDFEQTREDRVIYSLARKTEVAFGDSTRTNAPPDYDRTHAAARMKAEDPSKSLVSVVNDNTLSVKSFVSSSKYEIAIDPTELRIFSCSCPDFANRRKECKHIQLVIAERPSYHFQLKPAFARPSAGSTSAPQNQPVVSQNVLAPALIEPVAQAGILSAPVPELSRSISNQVPAASLGILPAPTPSAPTIVAISPPTGSTQTAQKRSVGVLERNSPIVIDSDLPSKAEPSRASAEVPVAKIALIKNALDAISKSVNDLSTGEEIQAALVLAMTLLDKATKAEGTNTSEEVQDALAKLNTLLERDIEGQGKKRRLE